MTREELVGGAVATVAMVTAPLYFPVCVGMWVMFVGMDLKGNTDDMIETGLDMSRAIKGDHQ